MPAAVTPDDSDPRQTTSNQVSAILLAAGRSQRMGAFKPLLPFGETTVIESCIDYLRRGGIENIIVVVGHRADEIEQRLIGQSVLFAVNPDPDSEMGSSIVRGIERVPASAQATLIGLTDQPAIPPSVVRTLTAQWLTGAKIVKPEFAGRGGHPVLIDLSFRSELTNLKPGSGLKAFFTDHREDVCRVAVDSGFIARDMDTWDDYRALHLEIFGFAPDRA